MARLIPCSACHVHVRSSDSTCPHCGASLRTVTAGRVPVLLMGLTLAGCPEESFEPAYGVPDSGVEPTTGGPMETSTGNGSATESGTTSASESSGSSTGMTDSGTGTDTMADSGTATLGEPEYGVPETTTG